GRARQPHRTPARDQRRDGRRHRPGPAAPRRRPGAGRPPPAAAGAGDGRPAAVRQPAGPPGRPRGGGLQLPPPRRRRRPGGRLRRRPVTAGDRPDLAAPSGAGAADPAPGPGPAGRPGVAAFDFDGTLARRDTLVPFLRRVRGSTRVAVAVARAAARTRDRDALKVAAIGHLFQGVAAADLERWGRAYAATLPPLLRPEMVARVRWHQRAGHAVVIVSASLGAYLRPLAERLGLDAALGVELAADASG